MLGGTSSSDSENYQSNLNSAIAARTTASQTMSSVFNDTSSTQAEKQNAIATYNQLNTNVINLNNAGQQNGTVVTGSGNNYTISGTTTYQQQPVVDTPINVSSSSSGNNTDDLTPVNSNSNYADDLTPTGSQSGTATTSTLAAPSLANSTINNSTVVTVANPANYTTLIAVNDQRVRLTPKDSSFLTTASMLAPLIPTQGLMFPYTPALQYAGTSNYGSQSLTHANQNMSFFTNVSSTTFAITGKFTAQTEQEAQYMLACLHFLRVTQKMRFGQGSSIGLPPPVLVLNGYGLAILNNLSVIITGFTMDMSDDVDYVQVFSQGISAWLPTFTTISITCTVQNTPNKLRTFNWDTFASGSLLTSGGWS
jgi:hypothetical protein